MSGTEFRVEEESFSFSDVAIVGLAEEIDKAKIPDYTKFLLFSDLVDSKRECEALIAEIRERLLKHIGYTQKRGVE